MPNIGFKESALQCLKLMALFPLLGVAVFTYSALFLIFLLPTMYFFPKSQKKISEIDAFFDKKLRSVLKHG